jgi:RES domain-containing protein
MTTLWRISNYADLSGAGGLDARGRWHTKGSRIVYVAESPAGAMIECIVHLLRLTEDGDVPPSYQLLRLHLPDGLAVKPLGTLAPVDWKERSEFTRAIGDDWLASMETPLARVASAIVPHTWNVLLNPLHPDAKRIEIAEVIKERFDNRLFRFGAG